MSLEAVQSVIEAGLLLETEAGKQLSDKHTGRPTGKQHSRTQTFREIKRILVYGEQRSAFENSYIMCSVALRSSERTEK